MSHCATVFLINAFLIAFGNNALLLPKATMWEESRLQWSHFSTHCFTYALQRDINKGYALIGLAMILKKGEGFHCESTVGEPLSVSSLWH